VSSVEELESFIEQIMSVPLLMRVLAHFFHNDYFGAAQLDQRFEGRPRCLYVVVYCDSHVTFDLIKLHR